MYEANLRVFGWCRWRFVEIKPENGREHNLGTPHDSHTRTSINIDDYGPTMMGITALHTRRSKSVITLIRTDLGVLQVYFSQRDQSQRARYWYAT